MKNDARRGFWSTLLSRKHLAVSSQPPRLGRRVSGPRSLRLEPCEARNLLAADITGIKFQDLTGNGFSADDTPLAGVTIELFQDNGDGVFDANVDTLAGTQVTAANGTYTFPAVADGLYFVREVVPAGFYQSGGPSFYTVQVQGTNAFTLNGVGIDDFSEPDPAEFYFINALNLDPTLIKHNVPGALGGQRDALIDVIGASNPLSANVVVGFNGIAGLFSFGSASPGTSATLQYDGADADIVGPPAGLINNQGLNTDLTNNGLATGMLLDFASIDPGLGTALGVEIRLTSPGGGTATFTDTTTFLESISAVNHFVPFANFTTANGFSFENVTSVEIIFNGAGVRDVDFEVDQILTVGQQANFANTALGSLAGFVYVDTDNDGVFDPGEPPIPNATVTLTGTDDLGAAVNLVVQTSATGAYLFDNLRAGTYTITETQPAGFLDGKDTIGTPGGTTANDVFSNIVLPVSFDGVNNNFGEILASSIAGFVYVDADNDGVFDPGEAPIPNTTITLTGTDDLGNAINQVDTTDAAGAYLFENLRPGTYTITETQPAGFLDGKDTIGTPGGTTANDVFSNIVLPTGFNGEDNNFGEILASSIAGFVYVDADNDGVFDPGEAPIPNTTITLTGTDDLGNAINLVDSTDAAGAYQFTNLRPGNYTLTETQPAGFLDGKDTIGTPGGTTANDVFSNIVLPTNFNGINNNFGEILASSIGGFVYVDADNDGIFDGGEAPIPNTTVTLTGTDDLGNAINQVDTTDAAGAYLFENLRPGTYTLTETQPAGFLDGKDTIGTPGGTTANDVFSNIVLPTNFNGINNNFGEILASSIAGFVYVDADNDGIFDGGEAPIPNTTVTLTGTDDLGNAINLVDSTDAAGAYQFTNLRPGNYTLTETQPAGFLDGKDTIGTPGGTTANDVFSNIVLPTNFNGINNNFGEILASSIGGFVYVDADNDGVFDP
ncbi:MAG: SdrD B-like domain-containing protein, partial [Planctomycetia bacterium]|nr:SdrD B-like domain-containing protein [Planctomycetia bacterium]